MIGLILRLLYAFSGEPGEVLRVGGDEFWYLANGLAMYQPEPVGVVYGNFRYAVDSLPSAPLYLLIAGALQLFFPLEVTIQILWALQSLAGVLTAWLSYRIAWRLSKDSRVALVTGIIMSLSPVMLIEPNSILTENFYILFLMAGFWLYVESIGNLEKIKLWQWVLVGVFFALATLTRATSLLFPFGLAGHLLLINGKKWKRGLGLASIFLLSYCLLAGTWTIFNWVKYERLVIGSSQFSGAFWRGAVEGDSSPSENDTMLGDESYEEQAAEVIASNPSAYLGRRINELLDAYLQPHGTIHFPGESLKAMAETWLRQDLSLEGFLRLISGESFWPKLLIYILHFWGLLGGIWGMWLSRKQWRISLALIGFIVYTSLLHLVVLALPRYIFPTYPVFWIFAAISLVWMWDRVKGIPASMPEAEKPRDNGL